MRSIQWHQWGRIRDMLWRTCIALWIRRGNEYREGNDEGLPMNDWNERHETGVVVAAADSNMGISGYADGCFPFNNASHNAWSFLRCIGRITPSTVNDSSSNPSFRQSPSMLCCVNADTYLNMLMCSSHCDTCATPHVAGGAAVWCGVMWYDMMWYGGVRSKMTIVKSNAMCNKSRYQAKSKKEEKLTRIRNGKTKMK